MLQGMELFSVSVEPSTQLTPWCEAIITDSLPAQVYCAFVSYLSAYSMVGPGK